MEIKGYQTKDLKGVHGIYKITNIVNDKVYVGSAVDLLNRLYIHTNDLRKLQHCNCLLQRAWSKYGEDSFVFSVLEFVENKTKLIEREQYYIDTLNPEYNIARIAGSRLGVPQSDITKEKCRKTSTGRRHTEESKKKMSEVQKGRVVSSYTKSLLRDIGKRRGVPIEAVKASALANKGAVRSEKVRRNISISLLGRRFSEDHKRNIGLANKGRVVPTPVRERIASLREASGWRDKISSSKSYPVIQLTLSGDFIAEYSSSKSMLCLGFKEKRVRECCRGEIASYKGYKFIYKKDYSYV